MAIQDGSNLMIHSPLVLIMILALGFVLSFTLLLALILMLICFLLCLPLLLILASPFLGGLLDMTLAIVAHNVLTIQFRDINV